MDEKILKLAETCILEQSGRGRELCGNHLPLSSQINISSKFLPGETSYPSLQNVWQN